MLQHRFDTLMELKFVGDLKERKLMTAYRCELSPFEISIFLLVNLIFINESLFAICVSVFRE